MAATHPLSLFTITVMIIFALSSGPVKGGLFDDIKTQFVDRLCVTQHLNEFQACFDQIKENYKSLDFNSLKEQQQSSDLEDACCNYLAYRDCIKSVADKHCGEYAANTVDSFANSIRGASGQCAEYDSVYKCWDMVALAGLIAIVVIVGIVLVAGICVICKRCCCN